MRILKWILDRIAGRAGGSENLFGITPRYEDLYWTGSAFSRADFEQITAIDRVAWRDEVEQHHELFKRLRQRLPKELDVVMHGLQTRLGM